jgi:hypothetical protein
MSDDRKWHEQSRYEGSNFATEKALATIYVTLFLLTVGAGAYKQLDRLTGGQSFASIGVSVR